MNVEERTAMLKFSRSVLDHVTGGGSEPSVPELLSVSPYTTEKRGIFVTLRRNGELRGCIGHIEPRLPLSEGIAVLTRKSALEDYRFLPVQAAEVPEITIEISVLTPMVPVAGYGEIVIGRDGIVLTQGYRSAVFLPQVATEQGWDLAQTLTALSRKAGLSPDAWRDPETRFETFQALHFSE